MPESLAQVGVTFAVLKATLTDIAVRYGLQALAALAILIVGLLLARWSSAALDRWLTKRGLDPSLRSLVVRICRILVIAASLVVAADKAGVPVMSLVAGIGVAGVGAGLALQGVLGNVFAGLTILFTRPFRVGEYIEIVGVHGLVTEVTLFSTTVLHNDNSKVVIPNRKIVGEILHNYGTRRQLQLHVGVAYATDLDHAISLARATLRADPRVLDDPTPLVGIKELGESAVVISVRPWVAVADYEVAIADLYQALLAAYRKGGVDMPFPQREVRLLGRGDAAVRDEA
jgi:small conductance mechanosensitive channel